MDAIIENIPKDFYNDLLKYNDPISLMTKYNIPLDLHNSILKILNNNKLNHKGKYYIISVIWGARIWTDKNSSSYIDENSGEITNNFTKDLINKTNEFYNIFINNLKF